jgi:hypothetical protein
MRLRRLLGLFYLILGENKLILGEFIVFFKVLLKKKKKNLLTDNLSLRANKEKRKEIEYKYYQMQERKK